MPHEPLHQRLWRGVAHRVQLVLPCYDPCCAALCRGARGAMCAALRGPCSSPLALRHLQVVPYLARQCEHACHLSRFPFGCKQVVPCLAIHDTMKHIKSDVGTVGFGGCMGMSGFLLAVGKKVGGRGCCCCCRRRRRFHCRDAAASRFVQASAGGAASWPPPGGPVLLLAASHACPPPTSHAWDFTAHCLRSVPQGQRHALQPPLPAAQGIHPNLPHPAPACCRASVTHCRTRASWCTTPAARHAARCAPAPRAVGRTVYMSSVAAVWVQREQRAPYVVWQRCGCRGSSGLPAEWQWQVVWQR